MREGGNNNTYKVRKMADGRIWMVQDLKFGTCPASTANWVTEHSDGATTREPTVYTGYVGHCRSSTYTNTGFLYTWPAAMQNTAAHYLSSTNSFQCTGQAGGTVLPAPGGCQGICPAGWHVPTGADAGEFAALFNATSDCPVAACAYANDIWEGAFGGWAIDSGGLGYVGEYGLYWSSTYYNFSSAYAYAVLATQSAPEPADCHKAYGRAVRCVMNY
jgi:uncharacterized protein (TIGR02145 family)